MAGMYRWADAPGDTEHPATILFSGTAHLAARQAQEDLAEHFGVGAELYSATSYKRLRDDAYEVERWNRLHPDEPERVPYVTQLLQDGAGPIVAVTDFMRLVPDQVARWMPRPYLSLGTDGFGRSDTRLQLRRFFETSPGHVVVAVLSALADQGAVKPEVVGRAIDRYGLDQDSPPPWEL